MPERHPDNPPGGVGFAAFTFDTNDPPAIARFWAALIGGSVEVDADGDALVRAADFPPLDFIRVPEAKSGKNRVHIDLTVPDVPAMTSWCLDRGATRAPDVYLGSSWVVLRDPDGNEFCLLPRAGATGEDTD
jgi:hypothetical protein